MSSSPRANHRRAPLLEAIVSGASFEAVPFAIRGSAVLLESQKFTCQSQFRVSGANFCRAIQLGLSRECLAESPLGFRRRRMLTRKLGGRGIAVPMRTR